MFLFAALFAWFSVAFVERYQRDSQVMNSIVESEGEAHFVERKPEWLWERFGSAVAQKGTSLVLSDVEVTDAQVAELGSLSHLGGLYLDRTAVSNDGLKCLKDLDGLVALSLRRTQISKLPSLSHMKQLVDLDLSFTAISALDLNGLDSLQNLRLRETKINDQTIQSFPPLGELTSLDISGSAKGKPRVSDVGIERINRKNFPKLTTIYLYHCDISDEELSRIQSEFPGIKIHR